MAKYHINPKTGNPNVCRAIEKCPFGDTNKHFESKDQAHAAYETQMVNGSPFAEKPKHIWDELTDEEFMQLEKSVLIQKKLSGICYTDQEYERHRAYIRRVVRSRPSTHKMYSKRNEGATVYTPEREMLHQEIVAHFIKQYQSIPEAGRAILAGGLPGSGKSTAIAQQVDQTQWGFVNPDLVKEKIIAEEQYPHIEALLPMEHDEMLMYEAQIISDQILQQLALKHKNIIVDKTLATYNPSVRTIDFLKEQGYQQIEIIFVDVDTDTAYQRIQNRHRAGLDRYASGIDLRGERCVPGSVLAGSTPNNLDFNSKNAETLVRLYEEGHIDQEPIVYDNTGVKPKQIGYEAFSHSRHKK